MSSGLDGEDRNEYSLRSIRLMRFLMGFLLVVALFLIEVGISEIVLDKDFRCREIARSARLALDPYAACLPEIVHYFFIVLSRGLFAIVGTQIHNAIAWLLMGSLYGILGGFLGQFTPRIALGIYAAIRIVALVIMTILTFLLNYIF